MPTFLASRIAVFLALAVLPFHAVTAEQVGPLSGIFGNVQLSQESGDLGGLEIELHGDLPDPYAVVVFCEGWCNQAYRVPLKINGNSFSFNFTEQLVDSSGAPAAVDQYVVEGRLKGGSLVVNLQLNDYRWGARLTRLKARFGLEVASPPTGGPISEPKQVFQ